MKKVYGYIRVSTVKQGNGVSLQEQREAIVRYAEKHELEIIHWFEEQETAAKQGRPYFTKMMKLLQTGKGDGVIIHKIDRSARNLKDWAVLGDLIDKGVEVHFAHESLDLETRGGRLAADIQAVIASDYIRNLRDETRKGIYGRLKQGLYPFKAPIGYVDNGGGGKLKTIDSIQGPLVRKAFELYANGNYTLDMLTKAMRNYGLKNSIGGSVSISTMAKILNNSFYTGVLRVKGKTFQGTHEPLISSKLFIQVQNVLDGKTNARPVKHDFLFRRIAKCSDCGYSLIGEKQKGHVYYRCHSRECPTKGIREELIEKVLVRSLKQMQLHPIENSILNEQLEKAQTNWAETQKGIEQSLKLQQEKISQKLGRLSDAYIESAIDKPVFEEKKEKLMIESQGLLQKINQLSNLKGVIFREAKNFLELIKSFKNTYVTGIVHEKRKIMKIITSNLTIEGKKVMITMKSPFFEIANRLFLSPSGLDRDTPRICTSEYTESGNFPTEVVDNEELRARMKELLNIILQHFELHPTESEDDEII